MGVYTKTLLASQVGGHPGVSTSEDGSLLFKPALVHEVNFYQSLASDPTFEPLRRYTPKFYGTLRFEGKVEDGNLIHEPPGGEKDKCFHLGKHRDRLCVFITKIHSIVLENLSHKFLKPNILDIKLGTTLYDDGASEEKKARMIQTAKNTTSLESGVRLTGFQVSASIGVGRGFVVVVESVHFFCVIPGS